MNFNAELIYNSLSFGNLSASITYELYKRGVAPNIFPIHGQVDLSSFDRLDDDFKLYLQSCINKAPKNFKKNLPSLRLWHILGSWQRVSEPSCLLTFFELDQITDTERNILNSYKKIFVTSQFSKTVMEEGGVESPVIYCPMGFDSIHVRKTNKKYYTDGSICWMLSGKTEKRKATQKVIRAWIKKYGVKQVGEQIKHRLHLHVTNPFFKPEDMNRVYGEIFENKPKPVNVEIYPYLKTLTEVNDSYNAADIVIDMSGGESISLPSLNCMGLGKHGVIHNATAMKDWAGNAGAVLVEPCGKEPVYDGVFFHPNTPYNQGNIFSWNEESFLSACDEAEKRFRANPVNEKGKWIQENYSFERGVNIILENLNA